MWFPLTQCLLFRANLWGEPQTSDVRRQDVGPPLESLHNIPGARERRHEHGSRVHEALFRKSKSEQSTVVKVTVKDPHTKPCLICIHPPPNN